MIAVRAHTVALLGNPNTGKTTLFNALCGMNQRVGNYPGVTVETKKGRCRIGDQSIDIIDLPGTYSLAPRSPDEMVAVEVILGQKAGEPKPDAVITIVDASNLERNLYLMTQALEAGVPVIVALNMIDVARAQGVTIDVEALSRNLGVPVVPLQANKSKGIEDLKRALLRTVEAPAATPGPKFPDAFELEVAAFGEKLGERLPPFLVRRLLLDVGGQTERMMTEKQGAGLAAEIAQARGRLATAGCGVPAIEARTRYGWIRQATHGCVERPSERVVTWTDRIDHVLTNKVWGTLIFLAIMLAVFLSIFVAAKPLMKSIGAGQEFLADWVKSWEFLEAGPFRSLLTSGIIGGVGSVIVFLPQILILFAFIAVLEDCGYMARAAYLMDKLMSKAGLNGKSFIPMLSSVACAIPGIMAARVIENRRDRFATILVAPLMSCSARLPVYALFIAAFFTDGYPFWMPGVVLFSMYMIGLVVAPAVAYLLKSTLLRGETPAFVMEMPLYKLPSLRLIVRRALEAGWLFLRRAGTIILATMIVIWALKYFPTTSADGVNFEETIERLEAQREQEEKKGEERDEERIGKLDEEINASSEAWLQQSYLGRAGKWIEPVVEPLGWDWRIGVAALSSFPAREVIVGTLGLVFGKGEVATDDDDAMKSLAERVQEVKRDDGSNRSLFTGPVALSIMVFFALCAQCASTLAVIKRETNSWGWPVFSFVYMTALAYVAALAVYQIGTAIVGG